MARKRPSKSPRNGDTARQSQAKSQDEPIDVPDPEPEPEDVETPIEVPDNAQAGNLTAGATGDEDDVEPPVPEHETTQARHDRQADMNQDIATPAAPDGARGLFGKYSVERNDGRDQPGQDKENARYFVLDYANDPVARVALRAYIDALQERDMEPKLVEDLNHELSATRKRV